MFAFFSVDDALAVAPMDVSYKNNDLISVCHLNRSSQRKFCSARLSFQYLRDIFIQNYCTILFFRRGRI
jgi:hypothetical protein